MQSKGTVAIIQARMGSTRLPGKVLRPILGKPVLAWISERLKRTRGVDQVMIATSDRQVDDVIHSFADQHEIFCYRGSEEDVLDRFFRAAVAITARDIIRVTGDCPLLDPGVVGELVRVYQDGEYDHCGVAAGAGVSNQQGICRFPDGLDAEIMRFDVLEKAWREATRPRDREHVTPFIWNHPKRFKIGTLYAKDQDYSQMRWTLDNEEDLLLIEWIYESLYPVNPQFGLRDILDLFQRFPERIQANAHFIGQEGYEQFWRDQEDE